MKRIFTSLIFLFLTSISFHSIFAEDFVTIPEFPRKLLIDQTSTLTSEEIFALSEKLHALELSKGSQIAVFLLPTVQPETIEQFSIRVAEKWKLGRKGVNDGVLIIIAINDRKMRIEVGYGLEGPIPDIIANKIIKEMMKPNFKKGDYAAGINEAVDALIKLINGEELPPPKSKKNEESDPAWIMFWCVVIAALITYFFAKRKQIVPGAVLHNISYFAGLTALEGTTKGMLLKTLMLGIPSYFLTYFFFRALLSTSGNSNFTSGGGSGWGGGSWGGGSSGWSSSSGSDWSSSSGGGDFGGGGSSGDW